MSKPLRWNYIKRVLKNVIKRAFGKLNNIFQNEFNENLSQQSTNVRFFLSHNWIQRSEFKNKRFQNLLIWPFRSAMFWNYGVGIHMNIALTHDVMKCYLTPRWDKKIRMIAVLHRKKLLLCYKTISDEQCFALVKIFLFLLTYFVFDSWLLSAFCCYQCQLQEFKLFHYERYYSLRFLRLLANIYSLHPQKKT